MLLILSAKCIERLPAYLCVLLHCVPVGGEMKRQADTVNNHTQVKTCLDIQVNTGMHLVVAGLSYIQSFGHLKDALFWSGPGGNICLFSC